MNNQEIILTVGISGAGKSSWCTEFIKNNPSYIRVNRDSIRGQITSTNSRWLTPELEELVTKIQDEQIRTILNNDYSVIIDNTNLQQKYINQIVNSYGHLANIKLQKFPCEVIDAKMRVSRRDDLDGTNLSYIEKQQENYLKLNLEKCFYKKREIVPYKHQVGLQECIICDLDGTLSLYDIETQSPYDRDFENDTPNEPLRKFIEEVTMWNGEDEKQSIKVFFFSGRNRKYEAKTKVFLNSCFDSDVEWTLVMRDEKDQRRDSIVKLEMFNEQIRDKYNVLAVFDDRLQVIEECWNPLDVFVFNCNNGTGRF